MSSAQSSRILPMKTAGTQHFIERTYREGGRYQWVRETYINALEAHATRVEFGVEWQAVDSKGVYRRVIADNGCGMSPDELVGFFNTFGGGGKPIGGEHENFGVGSKTSLLPWNSYGLVVVSWKDGVASMIWVMRDPDTGEYGLKLERAQDPDTGEETVEVVYAPYFDEEHGCDWEGIKPDWIDDHGTVIVLLGGSPGDHTVLGDPNRSEADIKGISAYLNRRIWIIDDDTRVTVDELRTENRGDWPRNQIEAHGPQPATGPDRRTNLRRLRGARYYIQYPERAFTKGKLAHSGVVTLADGTKVRWYLWDGVRPAVQSYAAISGYIATAYQNELWDVMTHQATYRSFGASEPKVRANLWLVIEPPVSNGKHGVYPRTDRNSLLLMGGPNAGGPLPILEWAGQFADDMPPAILTAIKAARGDTVGSIEDSTWLERLIERFGSRWRIPKLRARKHGPLTVEPTQPGTTPKVKIRVKPPIKSNGGGGGGGGRGGQPNTGGRPGGVPAKRTRVAGGVPRYRTVNRDELRDGILAAWQPNDPIHKEGAVLINQDHPVLREQIEHWQSMYAVHHEKDIEHDVIAVYGELAVAKVAHSEHLKGILLSNVVDEKLRSDEALTMALLGLVGEDSIIATRLGGKYRRRQSKDVNPRRRRA